MIYFTTFILTFLLSHIARATPACGDITSPEELYDSTYADGQYILPNPFANVTWSSWYGDKNGNTHKVACASKLAKNYPQFGDFPNFPYIGGSIDVKSNINYCGTCWNLTDTRTGVTIFVTLIDIARDGYNISKAAFTKLNGGHPGTKLTALHKQVSYRFCEPKLKAG
jgi:Cerato-platanin